MIKNKILVLTIGILTLGGAAGAQTLQTDNGPAELPPASFKGKQYVDSKGCVYIRAGYGKHITWVPRVNRERRVFCSPKNIPSLSATQLAAISGIPATRIVKPAAKKKKTGLFGTSLFAVKPVQKATPDTIASTPSTTKTPVKATTATPNKAVPKVVNPTPAIQSGTTNSVAEATVQKPVNSVRGTSVTARRTNRNALRTEPQAGQSADVTETQKSDGTHQQTAASGPVKPGKLRFDPIHGITVYGVVLDADITPRGDAQMALVWSNTVPRKLVAKGRLKLIATNTTYTTATKSR